MSRSFTLRLFRICARLATLLLVLFAGVFVYLHFVGVPARATDRWISALAFRGVYVEVGRITYNPFHGAIAHRFFYFDTSQRAVPMLEAEIVELDLDVLAWFQHRSGLNGLGVRDGTVRISTHGPLVQADPSRVLVIEHLDGRLRVDADRIEVRDLRASALGLRLNGEGHIRLSPAPMDSDGPADPDSAPRSSASWVIENGPTWLPDLVAQLNRIEFDQAPEVDVSFDIDARDPLQSDVTLSARGQRTTVRGVAFDHWELEAAYRDRVFKFHDLSAAAADAEAVIQGTYDVDRAEITLDASSSLPPTHWISLIPMDWRDRLDATKLFFLGPVRLDLRLGPAPLPGLWAKCAGRVELERAEIRGVWIEKARLGFAITDQAVELTDIDAEVGRDAHRGSLRGRLTWDFNDHRYRGRLESQMDYVALLPVLGERWVRLVRSTQFPNQPPHVAADFSGTRGVAEAFKLEGTFEASEFLYRETFIRHLRTDILSTNRVLTLARLSGRREEGSVDGLIRIDFRERRLDLDLDGVADLKAVGRVSGERLERILRPFSFDGPTHAKVEGSIHFSTNGVTDLRATGETGKLGLQGFVADRASIDLIWTGRHVMVTNIHANLYGGTLTGTIETRPDEASPDLRYALDMKAYDVAFLDVVRTLAHKEGEPYRGRIDGGLRLSGLFGSDAGRTAAGEGEIRIRDGRIMMIPLFGPLSNGLSKLFPGLGFSKQTDLTASFEVADLQIHTDDAGLLGDLFSLSAVGDYFIKGKGLDFDVEFMLLGEGLVSDVVQFVMSPISRLLRFDLEGTLDAPQWRPKNLPRELIPSFP